MKVRTIGLPLLLLAGLLYMVPAAAQKSDNKYHIIPEPVKLVPAAGQFTWAKNTVIKTIGKGDFKPVLTELQEITGKTSVATKTASTITIKLDPSIPQDEGYKLSVSRNAITVSARSTAGAFWAISTLKQLIGAPLFSKTAKAFTLPCTEIEDTPRFAWRGIHLDVSRHFFDLAYLRTMIDRMALYKFNKFHLHLTDDQGWRIEIKKYPGLTEKGAWRTLNAQDSSCLAQAKENPDFQIPEKHFKMIDGKRMYGGFYTQEEMKGLIKYAQDRSIEIIPEIDMPGHMMAATNLMPWLTSKGTGGQAKNFSEPICPCKETTFEFAENVFSEIAALFPSQYIHLGADEVEKSSWKNIPECEEVMKREGLKSVDELQSYFVRRMEKFFNSKGKKLIGWDEILDGGVSPTATMMYWRTWVPDAPKHAAAKGNEVIMTPGEYCYFDAQQDGGSLKKVYSFDPYKFNLAEAERKYILGVQANIWTEYIPSEQRLEYMVFPRMLAMAEVAWNTGMNNWTGFENRVNGQLKMLDAMKVNYRLPDLDGFSAQSVFVDKAILKINKPAKELTIRYTTDGTIPTIKSAIFNESLTITKPVKIKAAAFRPNGMPGDIYSISYEQRDYLKPVTLSSPQPGLNFSYYPRFYKSVTNIDNKDLAKQDVTPAIEIPVDHIAGSFATKHNGYFYANETGIYTFYLRSDDGSVLKIGNQVLIDNDGLHPAREKAAQIALEKGYHPFELLFIEGGGGYTLQLQYQSPSNNRQNVRSKDFVH